MNNNNYINNLLAKIENTNKKLLLTSLSFNRHNKK
jgi:hypothetical protein